MRTTRSGAAAAAASGKAVADPLDSASWEDGFPSSDVYHLLDSAEQRAALLQKLRDIVRTKPSRKDSDSCATYATLLYRRSRTGIRIRKSEGAVPASVWVNCNSILGA